MATKNLFAVLDSDDEDVPVKVTQQQQQQPQANKENKPNRPATAPAKKQNNRPQNNKNTPREGQEKRNNGERRPNTRNNNDRPRENGDRPRGPRPQRSGNDNAEQSERPARSEHGGRHGGRGGRGGRGPRNFDRRSGTGRGRETSKSGGGARNWGNEKDETELNVEAELQEGQTTTVSSEEEAPVEEEEVEAEEDNEMTLDEYLAKQQEARTGDKFAAVTVRTVENEFDESSLVTKDGKTPDFIEASYEKVYTKKSSGRKKQVITDVGFQSAPTYTRRGRGDGDNRRGGGRRGGRRSHAPNVSDLKAFPSLA